MKIICTLFLLYFLVQGVENAASGQKYCLESWSLRADQCYWVSPDKLTFEDAKSSCEQKGAKLVEPMNQEENEQVYELASNQTSKKTIYDYYIGVVKLAEENG